MMAVVHQKAAAQESLKCTHPHTAAPTFQHFSNVQHFQEKFVGQLNAVELPPHSPDLIHSDFYFGEYLKSQVCNPIPATVQQL